MQLVRLVACCSVVASLGSGCAETPTEGDQESPPGDPPASVLRPPNAELRSPPCTGDGTVTYHGGALIGHPKIVTVFWGTHVDSSLAAALPGFYLHLVESPYLDGLSEYNQPGMSFGRGTTDGPYDIFPNHSGTTISQSDVAGELSRQIELGALPAPTSSTVYMVHFPAAVTPTIPSGPACSAFCGYHSYYNALSGPVHYAVLPECGGTSCATVPGATLVEKVTSAASHEIVEAMASPEPPMGLFRNGTVNSCEISDGCAQLAHPDRTLPMPELGTDRGYLVERYWSQAEWMKHNGIEEDGCIVQKTFDQSDILWRNTDQTLRMWQVAGPFDALDTSSQVSVCSGAACPGFDWTIQGIGDFNGDGHSDMLWRNTNGIVSIWMMNGPTRISQRQLPVIPGPEWVIKGVGDFNGDGHSDILWRNTNSHDVRIWYLGADATLVDQGTPSGCPSVRCPGPEWEIQAVGDFNGDGMADIAWRNTSGTCGAPTPGYCVDLWMLRVATVLAEVRPSVAPSPDWTIQGAADFNGDGVTDLVWRQSTHIIKIWLLDHTGMIASTSQPSIVPNNDWTIQGVGHFAGGDNVRSPLDSPHANADILWRKYDGSVAISLFSGAATLTTAFVSPTVPGNAWTIQGVGAF